MKMNMSMREDLISIYQAAIDAVGGRACVRNALSGQADAGPYSVIAIGKAATAMYQGAVDALGEQIADALVITKEGHAADLIAGPCLVVIESGHPQPTQASLDAGQQLLAFITRQPKDQPLVFLISGGASSLVEVLPADISLQTLRELNQWLLGSGLDIHVMNTVRKSISLIKGGRLATYLDGSSACVLLISDVPGDEPASIGSGLLVPDLLNETEAPIELPEWIEKLMAQGEPAPANVDAVFDDVSVEVIATLADAKHAAAEKGRELGYEVYENSALLGGDAVTVGRQLACELLDAPEGLHIWGGETTVNLPETPGRGGRNQHLALAAAIELEGESNVALLAAGTDGSDGPTDDAGALVDGATISRGESEISADACLKAFDSGAFLEASGDLINTGPTGTNVMDLMLGIKS